MSGVETDTARWRRHKRLFAGTATVDDITLTRNLVALGRANFKEECAKIRKLCSASKVECAKIRKLHSASMKLHSASRAECARIRARLAEVEIGAVARTRSDDDDDDDSKSGEVASAEKTAAAVAEEAHDSDDDSDLYLGKC